MDGYYCSYAMTQPEEARDIKFEFTFISAMVQLSTIKVSFTNKPLFTSYTTLTPHNDSRRDSPAYGPSHICHIN